MVQAQLFWGQLCLQPVHVPRLRFHSNLRPYGAGLLGRSAERSPGAPGEELREEEFAATRLRHADAAEVEGAQEVLAMPRRLDPALHGHPRGVRHAAVVGQVPERQALSATSEPYGTCMGPRAKRKRALFSARRAPPHAPCPSSRTQSPGSSPARAPGTRKLLAPHPPPVLTYAIAIVLCNVYMHVDLLYVFLILAWWSTASPMPQTIPKRFLRPKTMPKPYKICT